MGVSMCAGLASRPCALADWISLAAKPATNGAAKLVPPRSLYSALPAALAAEARPGTPNHAQNADPFHDAVRTLARAGVGGQSLFAAKTTFSAARVPRALSGSGSFALHG